MPKPVVTLRSLAKEAGVSPMTVSLALKNSHEISAQTGDKIRVLAQKRGYRPDPTMRKLMQHLKSRSETRFKATVCAIIAEDVNLPFTLDNYPNRIRLGMKQRAEELGYATDILNLNDFSSKEQIDRILISRGIEGLVSVYKRGITMSEVILVAKVVAKIARPIKYDDEYDAIAVGLTFFASYRNK